MNLPIDEMLFNLEATLELFEADPSCDAFDAVQNELHRIRDTVENDLNWEGK